MQFVAHKRGWGLVVLGAMILTGLLIWQQSDKPHSGEQPPLTTAPNQTAITTPRMSALVSVPLMVQGVVDPDDLRNEESLWLFVKAANGRYYPQIARPCRPALVDSTLVRFVCRHFSALVSACQPPESIVLETGHYDWEMTASLIPATSPGEHFELLLGTLAPSTSAQVFAVFQAVWCQSGISGFDESELYGALRFQPLDRVVLSRE